MRCRENRTCEDFNACYDPRTPSCLSMQLTVYKHFSFKPPPTSKMRFVFLIVSSTVYHSPYCYTVLNGFWTSIHLYVRAFLPFFLTQVFTPFHICASLFSASFCSFFFLFRIFFLYPIFPRTCFIALNFILLRASFDATITLSISVFVSILAQSQASYNTYTS